MPGVEPDDPEVKQTPQVNLNDVMEVPLQRFVCYHSSWPTLLRRTALLLRVKLWLRKKALRAELPDMQQAVRCEELKKAEDVLLHFVQICEFPSYTAADKMPRNGSLAALNPQYNEDGLLVVGGRISRANISQAARHPIILPKTHHVVELIVTHTHMRYMGT